MTAALRDLPALAAWRAAAPGPMAFVPTMGALHEGHLALMRAARAWAQGEGGRVLVSIFVNPTQFNNAADLAAYPRVEEADLALLRREGVEAVFLPKAAALYPPGFASEIHVGRLGEIWEGAHRPGHFTGVATIVAKLFALTGATRAYFGEKDWQQVAVIAQMVRDLNLPVTLCPCPTVRAADGLALSSRNARLSPAARAKAPALYAALEAAAKAATPQAVEKAKATLQAAGFDPIDYLALVDAETLMENPAPGRPRRLLAAATLEGVRLIDNIAVAPASSPQTAP